MAHRICTVAFLLFGIFAAIESASADDVTVASVPLLSTGTTIVGETLHYPTNGPAHVTAAIVTLAPGAKTVLHRHGIPLFAYILEGEITVDYGDRGKRTYRASDALMEAMDVPHFGADAGPSRCAFSPFHRRRRARRLDIIPVKP